MKKTKQFKRKLTWFNYLVGREMSEQERSRIRQYVEAKNKYYGGEGENENSRIWKAMTEREQKMYKRLMVLHQDIVEDAREIESQLAMVSSMDGQVVLEDNDYIGWQYVAEVDA